jgi:AcrR family transcriptional regulator
MTDAQLTAAALAIIDRQGLAALSMRAVADELGVGTMSLYRYVSDREELERLVVDRVLAGIDLHLPPRGTWQHRVMTLGERVRDAVGAHSAVVPLLLAHRHSAPNSLRFAEVLLGVLSESRLRGRERVIAFRSLLSYILGALQYQRLGPLDGAGTSAIVRLPRDQFPHLSATAREAQRISARDEFRGGLKVLLRGIGSTR